MEATISKPLSLEATSSNLERWSWNTDTSTSDGKAPQSAIFKATS